MNNEARGARKLTGNLLVQSLQAQLTVGVAARKHARHIFFGVPIIETHSTFHFSRAAQIIITIKILDA